MYSYNIEDMTLILNVRRTIFYYNTKLLRIIITTTRGLSSIIDKRDSVRYIKYSI